MEIYHGYMVDDAKSSLNLQPKELKVPVHFLYTCPHHTST